MLNPVTEYIYLSRPIAVKRPTTIEFVHPPVPFLSRGHLLFLFLPLPTSWPTSFASLPETRRGPSPLYLDSIDFPLGRTDYSIDPFLRFSVPISSLSSTLDRDPRRVASRERRRPSSSSAPEKNPYSSITRPRRFGCKFHGCRAACLLPLQVRSTPSGPRGPPSTFHDPKPRPWWWFHEMLLRGLGPARFKEAELIRLFAWKQRQGWPSIGVRSGRGWGRERQFAAMVQGSCNLTRYAA